MNYTSVKSRIFRNKGIVAGLLSLFILILFRLVEGSADYLYRNFIFQLFRWCWDHSLALLPFALFYLIAPVFIIWIVFFTRANRQVGKRWFFIPANLAGWLITAFFWMWGYNYSCRDNYTASSTEMSPRDLVWLGTLASSELVSQVNSNETDFSIVDRAMRDVLSEKNIRTWGSPRVFSIGHHGFMRRMGIAGIYFPFSGQSHVDGSFLNIQSTFIAAHELAHAYGIGGEADADMTAFLCLMRAGELGNGAAADAAWFELLRSVRNQLRSVDDDLRIELDATLSAEVVSLLEAVKNNSRQYPLFFSEISTQVNDKYLRLMGVDAGVTDYDRFVLLAWKHLKEN